VVVVWHIRTMLSSTVILRAVNSVEFLAGW
jgi:hypothetical protein